jgi:hypothetical protein
MILYPNLPSAVGVDDVRLLGPVWPRRYARFLEEALRLRLVDRLEGSERQLFHGRRWVLDFLGVRRLVSAGALATSIEPEDLVPDGACPSLPPKAVVVRIDDEYVRAIYHHPADPGEIPCRYFISLGKPCGFMFRVGLHPDVWKRGMGDGVTFQVTEGGEELFSRWVDPKNRLEDRRWFTGAVTTGGELSLHALPGETSLYDWALWGDPRATGPEYPLIQKGQVSVYDNPRAMPYVSVRHQVRWVGDAETALRHVLSSEGESPTAAEAAPPSWWSVGALGGRAELRRRDGARIEIAVEGGGLLLVRELFYPGWEARVDGERVPVVAADYLFQGVPVPPGLRTVVLRFNPLSFRVGLGISAASLVVLGVWSRRRRMSKPAGSRAPMVEPSP